VQLILTGFKCFHIILAVSFSFLTNRGTNKIVKRPIIPITPENNSRNSRSVAGILYKCVFSTANAVKMVSVRKIRMYRKIPPLTFSKKYKTIPATVTGIIDPKMIVDTFITWKEENPVILRNVIAKIKLNISAKSPPSNPDNAYLVSCVSYNSCFILLYFNYVDNDRELCGKSI